MNPRSVRCRLGWHRWVRAFVGSSWHPDLWVLVCRRCGIEDR